MTSPAHSATRTSHGDQHHVVDAARPAGAQLVRRCAGVCHHPRRRRRYCKDGERDAVAVPTLLDGHRSRLGVMVVSPAAEPVRVGVRLARAQRDRRQRERATRLVGPRGRRPGRRPGLGGADRQLSTVLHPATARANDRPSGIFTSFGKELRMRDLIFVLLTIGVFVVLAVIVRGIEKL